MRERSIRLLGWTASAGAIAMYLSYIDQIRLNLAGDPGSIVQPAMAVVNCSLWTSYGLARPRRDWPIIAANLPGIVLGALAFLTAL